MSKVLGRLEIDAICGPICRDGCFCDLLNDPFLLGRVGLDQNDFLKRLEVLEVLLLEARARLKRIRSEGGSIALAGGRHAMGGQQFADGEALLDTRGLRAVLAFDRERGEIEIEAGTDWPQLVAFLVSNPVKRDHCWAITQKQTGADRLTIGGSLSSNVHGRGLSMRP